jgi:UDP-N-acetylglucosamine 1-carboxyvinyltransferase
MDSITISAPERLRAIPYIKTAPYPGFPTDMQSQFMAALIGAEGVSVLEETIFEDRFKTAFELQKMGADIRLEGSTAVITGVKRLCGADVTAKDLRGGAALVVAALAAEGESRIDGCEYIQRGYEAIDRDLVLLGGRIRW